MRPRLLDLYCCQGGAAMGYHQAGFDVFGVDIQTQPRYPFPFHLGDAIAVLDNEEFMAGFDAIHASPPCQAHSKAQKIRKNDHPDLIADTRAALEATGKPYVIENVPGAPLKAPVLLCGCMFPELNVYRERHFETSGFRWDPPLHYPHTQRQTKMGRPPVAGERIQPVGNFSGAEQAREAMGMPWASREGLREAIPPAYTRFIGEQLMAAL